MTLIIGGSVVRCLLNRMVSIVCERMTTLEAYELGETLPLAVALSFELLRAA